MFIKGDVDEMKVLFIYVSTRDQIADIEWIGTVRRVLLEERQSARSGVYAVGPGSDEGVGAYAT